jgi:hypothetical protein
LHFYVAVYCLLKYIRRLSQVGGDSLEKLFEQYPFLGGYFEELLRYLPQGLTWDQALGWWEKEITAWEKTSTAHLPLRALTEQSGISFHNRSALILVGLVEEDSRFGTLFARLQEPLAFRRPCLELVRHIMLDESTGEDLWSICQPLLSAGLLDVANRDVPRSEWVLRVPAVLWDVLRDEATSQPAPWCQYHPWRSLPPITKLIFPESFLRQLEQVPVLARSGKAEAIILRGMQGSERLQVIGAVAGALGRGMIEVDGAALSEVGAPSHGAPWHPITSLLGPLSSMTHSLPVITYDLGPGETVELPPLTGYQGPIGIIMGFEGGIRGRAVEKAITLMLPAPRHEHRIRYWQEALAGYQIEHLSEISERFHLPGGYIRQAATMAIAHAALEQRETIRLDDVREACRALNRQRLDTLATRLEVGGSWGHLVVSASAVTKLRELERRCHHRERLLDHLGPAFDTGTNRGVRALFTGASGTGKTLAGKVLAAELGMDLYRVDLAAVINKYIGETEKNLHRVLSTAEELDVILLLDEGDALMGSRTEVKSANDRYANLETNYLLQRLENYQGIVIVTTNLGESIDTAFQRRMDVVVHFIRPQAQERWHIWQLHLPENHAVDDAYLEEVAIRCAVTGGQIRNAALHATLLAVEGSGLVTRGHLAEAIQSEYRKSGAVCPLTGNTRGEEHGGVEAFLDLLSH